MDIRKADWFALGASLLELCLKEGRLPSGGQSYRDLREDKIPVIFTAPISLMNEIKRLMSADPTKRLPSKLQAA